MSDVIFMSAIPLFFFGCFTFMVSLICDDEKFLAFSFQNILIQKNKDLNNYSDVFILYYLCFMRMKQKQLIYLKLYYKGK